MRKLMLALAILCLGIIQAKAETVSILWIAYPTAQTNLANDPNNAMPFTSAAYCTQAPPYLPDFLSQNIYSYSTCITANVLTQAQIAAGSVANPWVLFIAFQSSTGNIFACNANCFQTKAQADCYSLGNSIAAYYETFGVSVSFQCAQLQGILGRPVAKKK